MEIEYGILALAAVSVVQLSIVLHRTNGKLGTKQGSIFVDTSVLMDGRIIHIAQTGFIPGTLVVPRSVIAELQFLADNSDADRRERARRGLDVIKQLQAIEQVSVQILQDGKATEGVDNRLLELAKQRAGILCTIDFNLNKVAQVEGIQVLNVNDLAKDLRMSYLPGDVIRLELKQKGQDGHQAVGHMSDGTMVVVEHASAYIGSEQTVQIIRNLQTSAGRMMFAKRVDEKQGSSDTKKKGLSMAVPKQLITKKKTQGRQPRKEASKANAENKQSTTKAKTQASDNKRARKSAQQPKKKPEETKDDGRASQKDTQPTARRQSRSRRPAPDESLISLIDDMHKKK